MNKGTTNNLKLCLIIISLLLHFEWLLADEGMWPIHSLEKSIIDKMTELGSELNPTILYSEHEASYKDAVVIFDNGCSGVFVSGMGLLFTNHHCAIGRIQQISNSENNLLENGYWATAASDEIPINGLSVKILKQTIDVTQKALALLSQNNSMRKMMSEIEKEYANKGLTFSVVAYPDGKYLLSVYEHFQDIRLVGIPAESIGNFGGQTDNFEWPRHSADFAVFRVYANNLNQPHTYSETNTPYRPKKFVSISTEGIEPNDFVFSIGFPGITKRNIHFMKLQEEIEVKNKASILGKAPMLRVLESAMSQNDTVKLMYSNKYFQQANSYKFALGINRHIYKSNVFDRKKKVENLMVERELTDSTFSESLQTIKVRYAQRFETKFAHALLAATLFSDAALFGIRSRNLVEQLERKQKSQIPKAVENYKNWYNSFIRNYHPPTDKEIVKSMIATLKMHVKSEFLPSFFKVIDKEFKGNINEYVDFMFEKSVFHDPQKFEKLMRRPTLKIKNDPKYQFGISVYEQLILLKNLSNDSTNELRSAEKNYLKGLIENDLHTKYPDANSSIRLTYGRILSFSTRDAVCFFPMSTHKGILGKNADNAKVYHLPQQFIDALHSENFGPYAHKGKLFTCFISDTDITSGNSGSPVFNKKGQLVGLAFDGNFESLPGMYIYDASRNRAVNVDIRYVLYIIDKFYNSQYIMNELIIQ